VKIKKTLALIMTAVLTVGTLAGCTQTTLNYSKERLYGNDFRSISI
jgi:hypothetical protein